MAKILIVTEPAKRDLADIYAYVSRRDPAAADHLVRSIFAHFEAVAATEHPGVPRDAIRPGLRLAVHGRYNIYFRGTAGEIVILHVIHSARDLSRISFTEGVGSSALRLSMESKAIAL